jgi:hypothetical protein
LEVMMAIGSFDDKGDRGGDKGTNDDKGCNKR